MEDDEEDNDLNAGSSLVKRKSRNYRVSGSGGGRRREVEEIVTSTTVQARATQSQAAQDTCKICKNTQR